MKIKKTNFSAVRYPEEKIETASSVSAADVDTVFWTLKKMLQCERAMCVELFDSDSDPSDIKTFLSEFTQKCEKASQYVCEHRHVVDSPAFSRVIKETEARSNELDDAFRDVDREADLEEERSFSCKIQDEMFQIATRFGVEKYL